MAEQTQQRSYKKTLNLPKTAFPMKANLVQNEPASQKRWAQMLLYDRLRRREHPAGPFSFHDGPPYANGSIHLGHLLNKVLKDFVVRSRSMTGHDTPFIPGWDCHGLPIEHKVMSELGETSAGMEPIAIRRKCRSSAEKFVKLQSNQMQRLLTLADYDHPYLTMTPDYEAAVLEVFADLVEAGLVYRGLKPVHWSIENRTALADAELEYYDRQDTSVYVLFEIDEVTGEFQLPPSERMHLMIWTTTPWTLPANLAVAVAPRAKYGLYHVDGKNVLVACDLAQKVLPLNGQKVEGPAVEFDGQDLLGWTYRHPFIDDGNPRKIVTADYVTLEDGTGLVHTAPGHGVEDYQTGIKEGLDIYCPVRADGTFDDTAPEWLRGKSVWDANGLVVEHLKQAGHLFHAETFTHSYPHDWRGKTPVIFRATEQWFVDVNKPFSEPGGPPPRHPRKSAGPVDGPARSLRGRAMDVTQDVRFYPDWGRTRMRGMLESRPDWCISRQRAWGLPIPAFYPPEGVEGEPLLTAASVRAVAKLFAEKGSDAWFLAPPEDLLQHYDPASDPDAPGWTGRLSDQSVLQKSHDIFDVWFESGSSWHAVIRKRFDEKWFPTDLYLEGSDQHRGWFQLSLLPSLAVTGQSPFRGVLTHGFMVDKHGHKMSKSLGNTLEVEDLLKSYGADVCRWWVSSLNTDNDIKVDESYFQLAGEEYRKVRNTIRFLLSNLSDFNVKEHAHTWTDADATSIDAWAMTQYVDLAGKVKACYENYRYREVNRLLFNFCNDTLSAVYCAAVKDRLYCDAPGSVRRRRTQSAMHRITSGLVRLLAPFLPHTADEAWRVLTDDDEACVHLQTFPSLTGCSKITADPDWQKVTDVQRYAHVDLERAKTNNLKTDNPLDAGLRIHPPAQDLSAANFLKKYDPVDLADLCGVSQFQISTQPWADAPKDQLTVEVIDLRDQPRCERSWKRDGTVKLRSDGGWLSDRDAEALGLA